jgi:hypothetical protein
MALFQKGHKMHLGKKHSPETRMKISNALKSANLKGERSSNWKGGEMKHICNECKIEFKRPVCKKTRQKYCSKICFGKSMRGKSTWNKGNKGFMAGEKHHWFGRNCTGENSPAYKKDRTQLKKSDRHHLSSAYQDWRKQVWLRDNWKCKIANPNCKGRIEAHHILSWRDYPELRYQINNGITLCHAHHPRKYAEEKRLSPYFMELVSVSK